MHIYEWNIFSFVRTEFAIKVLTNWLITYKKKKRFSKLCKYFIYSVEFEQVISFFIVIYFYISLRISQDVFFVSISVYFIFKFSWNFKKFSHFSAISTIYLKTPKFFQVFWWMSKLVMPYVALKFYVRLFHSVFFVILTSPRINYVELIFQIFELPVKRHKLTRPQITAWTRRDNLWVLENTHTLTWIYPQSLSTHSKVN